MTEIKYLNSLVSLVCVCVCVCVCMHARVRERGGVMNNSNHHIKCTLLKNVMSEWL